jgi:hypothetical protein
MGSLREAGLPRAALRPMGAASPWASQNVPCRPAGGEAENGLTRRGTKSIQEKG